MKKLLLAALLLATATAVMVWRSPYHFSKKIGYRAVVNTVEIGAPPDSVFQFLGNSANASRWSIFVHHISQLNPNEVADGQVGVLRRCFQQADEQGVCWDERILIADRPRQRRLSCFNLKNFSMQAEGLATDQIYEPLDGGRRTRLTFTLFFLEKPDGWTTLKTYLAAYKIKSIFEQNMLNIKRLCNPDLPVGAAHFPDLEVGVTL